MTTNYTSQLLRLGQIAGTFYSKGTLTNTLVVYGLGAPIVPDSGNLPDANVIMGYNTDLFVPDYIGNGRSSGTLTPQNCIKTFLKLYDEFTKGTVAKNHYTSLKIKLKYKNIIFMGRSFGGTYVPLLPRYNPKITNLCLIYPAVDNKSCGTMPNEESNEDFMRAMLSDGYKYLYRGIEKPVWTKHLNNQDGLAPIDNIEHLKDAKIFIGHGKADECISYTQSVRYYNKILKNFPDKLSQFKLKLYNNTGHEPATSNQAVKDCLTWLGISRYNQ